MMWWKILLGILALIVILLIIPVRYSVKAEMWKATVTVKGLGGLIQKSLIFPKPKKQKTPEASGKSRSEPKRPVPDEKVRSEPERPRSEPERPVPIEKAPGETAKTGPPREKPPGKEKTPAPPKEPEISKKEKPKKKRPSLFKQICFAAENGTIEAALAAAAKILAHSFPGKWRIRGEFGSGDPMTTGTIQGMAQTFLPRVTEEVVWKYTDEAHRLEGEADGRVIPIYVLGIVLRLAVARPVRQFWRYRQGGI